VKKAARRTITDKLEGDELSKPSPSVNPSKKHLGGVTTASAEEQKYKPGGSHIDSGMVRRHRTQRHHRLRLRYEPMSSAGRPRQAACARQSMSFGGCDAERRRHRLLRSIYALKAQLFGMTCFVIRRFRPRQLRTPASTSASTEKGPTPTSRQLPEVTASVEPRQ